MKIITTSLLLFLGYLSHSQTPIITNVAGGNSEGSAANQLSAPLGLAVSAGDLYIADGNNNRVQKWGAGATSGVTVAGGNGAGNAANQISLPAGLILKGTDLYISEFKGHRVTKWTLGATSGVTVAGGNGAGSAANQLNGPVDIAMDAQGNLYIADAGNNRVQKWAVGATTGVTVAGGNGAGIAANQLDHPLGIDIDASGNLYIVDNANSRVQKWAVGATTGVTIAGGNGKGNANNQLDDPYWVRLDRKNNEIYVADGNNFRVQNWVIGATQGVSMPGCIGYGTAVNQLKFPRALYLDQPNKSIYVTDHGGNDRVVKYDFSTNLPVTLSQFTANLNNVNILCQWQTTNEVNVSYINVQKSINGKEFTTIGKVVAKGEGSYSYTDNKPANGINYYRLQSIDNDGSSSYSKVVSVNFGDNQSFSIIPNPARDFATISFTKSVDKATIAVYDITGKQVITKSLSGSTNVYKLNTQSLKSGLYVIKVNTAIGNYNQKLLINK